MSGEPKDDPLTIVGGVIYSGYSKDTGDICAEGEEGSTEGREEHNDNGEESDWRGKFKAGREEVGWVTLKFK